MTGTVGIIGVGVMGSAMATNLLARGFDVIGYDIEADALVALEARGGDRASSVTEVARKAEVVLLSLPTAEALAAVTEELVESRPPSPPLVLEMGTMPLVAKQAARTRLAAAGMELMDAPVSGTGIQAADGTLVVLASGSADAYSRVEPILAAISRSRYHLGEFGAGSVMKYIANLLVAIHSLAAAEAHALGIASGLDPALVQKVMSDGTGASKILDIRGPMMAADRYEPPSPRLDIILKDAHIIAEYAAGSGAPTFLLDAAIPIYEAAARSGLAGLDAAALCRYLEESAHLVRRLDRASGRDI